MRASGHDILHKTDAVGLVGTELIGGSRKRIAFKEWAYVRLYTSNEQRTQALDDWLHIYNDHRAHTASAATPPISRVNNPAGQNT